MDKKSLSSLIATMTLAVSSLAFALVNYVPVGRWPESWPKELDSYRDQAAQIDVMHGIQETVYQIPFTRREDFEKAWPHILSIKTPGAPLILERSPSTYNVSGSTCGAGVRILWPSGGKIKTDDGKSLIPAAPWPEYLASPSGELPEYIVNVDGTWVSAETTWPGFKYRARVDIVLITDGTIVDLNLIPLPADTPIVDNRFKE